MPRPKQFDPDQALDRAMRLFWKRGYEGTSVQDLVEELQINRFSLYDTFGDKKRLFEAALERYAERVFSQSLAALEASGDGLSAIEAYFQVLIDGAPRALGRKGCLLANTVVECAPHDAQLARRLRVHCVRVEQAFLSALERAERAHELKPGLDLKDRARVLVLLAQGVIVTSKALRHGEWAESALRVALHDLRAPVRSL